MFLIHTIPSKEKKPPKTKKTPCYKNLMGILRYMELRYLSYYLNGVKVVKQVAYYLYGVKGYT